SGRPETILEQRRRLAETMVARRTNQRLLPSDTTTPRRSGRIDEAATNKTGHWARHCDLLLRLRNRRISFHGERLMFSGNHRLQRVDRRADESALRLLRRLAIDEFRASFVV